MNPRSALKFCWTLTRTPANAEEFGDSRRSLFTAPGENRDRRSLRPCSRPDVGGAGSGVARRRRDCAGAPDGPPRRRVSRAVSPSSADASGVVMLGAAIDPLMREDLRQVRRLLELGLACRRRLGVDDRMPAGLFARGSAAARRPGPPLRVPRAATIPTSTAIPIRRHVRMQPLLARTARHCAVSLFRRRAGAAGDPRASVPALLRRARLAHQCRAPTRATVASP